MKRMVSLLLFVLLVSINICTSALSLSDLKIDSSKEHFEALIPPLPYRILGSPTKCVGIVAESQFKGVGYLFAFPPTQGEMLEILFDYSDCLGALGYSHEVVTIADSRGVNFESDTASILVLPFYLDDSIVVLVNEPRLLSFFEEGKTPQDVFVTIRDDIAACTAESAQEAAIATSLYWPTSNQAVELNSAIHQNFETVMPELIRADYFTDWSSNGEMDSSKAMDIVKEAVKSSEGIDASLARTIFIGKTILPLISGKYGIDVFSKLSSGTFSDDIMQNLPAFTDELQTDAGEGKYIVLNTKDEFKTCQINYIGNLMLPAGEAASRMDEATRYIVCSTTWKERASGQWFGGTPYKPETAISIYDAKTGKLISSLEPVIVNPYGFITTNYPGPYYYDIYNAIRNYFDL